MPTYRTGNSAFCIQQVGYGSTGSAPNTANYVGTDGWFGRPVDVVARYEVQRATEGERQDASAPVEFVYAAAGSIVFAGAAPVARTLAPGASGAFVLSGAASTQFARTFVASGAGGVAFAGTAPLAIARIVAPSGGVAWGGAASAALGRVVTGSGTVTLAGAAAIARVIVPQLMPGVFVWSGAAAVTFGHAYIAAGRIGLAGAAEAEGPAGPVTIGAGGTGAAIVVYPEQRRRLRAVDVAGWQAPAPPPRVATATTRFEPAAIPLSVSPRIFMLGSARGALRFGGGARATLARRDDAAAAALLVLAEAA